MWMEPQLHLVVGCACLLQEFLHARLHSVPITALTVLKIKVLTSCILNMIPHLSLMEHQLLVRCHRQTSFFLPPFHWTALWSWILIGNPQNFTHNIYGTYVTALWNFSTLLTLYKVQTALFKDPVHTAQ